MPDDRATLTQFLADACGRDGGAPTELRAVILDVALACRGITKAVTFRARHGYTESPVVVREGHTATIATIATLFLRAVESNPHVAGILCDGMQAPSAGATRDGKARYLVVFASLDQPSNLDINLPVGSIFSVLRAPRAGEVGAEDFLQAGSTQVAAGYVLYGASTNLVLSVGAGVHGFTLDPGLSEFLLSHPDLKIPSATHEIAANAAHSPRWERGLRRYLSECLAGTTGPRARHYDVRGFSSLVAEAHRIFVRGGIFLCPQTKEPRVTGSVHLLQQANPVAFLVEQAGGRASTGHERVLDKVPLAVDEQVGLIFGSRDEVERIEQYHYDNNTSASDAPLFGIRGLFRAPT